MSSQGRSITRKIKRLFKSNNSIKESIPYTRLVNTNLSNIDQYKAAGSVFTDKKLILAGYQPRKRKPVISGIGGKKEEGETYIDTALRETLEELFEFKLLPKELLNEIKSSLVPQKIIQNGDYIMVVYTFNDLELMLRIIQKYKLKSVLYDTFPKTLMDLLFKRKLSFEGENANLFFKPEISYLALLPLVEHNKANPFVDLYFIEDMPILLK